MPLMTSTELFSDDAWGDVDGFRFGTLGLPGRNAVHDVPWRGHTYSVVADANSTKLTRDGRVLVTASGGRVVVRNFVLTRSGASFEVTADQEVKLTVHPEDGPSRRITVPAGTTDVRL
jgi:hypothetical protein